VGDIVSESTGDFISVRLGDFVGIRTPPCERFQSLKCGQKIATYSVDEKFCCVGCKVKTLFQ